MNGLTDIEDAAAAERLGILGSLPAAPGDGLPAGTASILLLGPAEPGFWAHVTAAPEFADGAPDPLDRWSRRVIVALAERFGAIPLFPFGPPPYRPFYAWAERSGRAWPSPVSLLVHDVAGLWISFRGALALAAPPPPAAPQASPCDSCVAKPCLTACPVAALTGAGYDLPACHGWLDSPAGAGCMTGGCLVRRACPVSQRHPRRAEQSAYHMRQFHR